MWIDIGDQYSSPTNTSHISDGDEIVYTLPPGPLFMNSQKLTSVLYHELIAHTAGEVKKALLLHIQEQLFPHYQHAHEGIDGHPNCLSPYIMGFGNQDSDKMAYLDVGVADEAIFIINKNSQLQVQNQMFEAGYGDPQLLDYCRTIFEESG